MTEHPLQLDGAPEGGRCIADETTTGALDGLTRPLSRSALAVAVLAVVDALEETGPSLRARVRAGTTGDHQRSVTVRRDGTASLLTRLVDLDLAPAGQAPSVIDLAHDPDPWETRWSVERRVGPDRLVLRWHRDSSDGVERFTTVAKRAHRALRLLADPEEASRWTQTATPSCSAASAGIPLPPGLDRRWQTRLEEETQAAASLLADWLRLDGLPPDGVSPDEWWLRLGISSRFRPLLDTWCRWLREHDLLASDSSVLRRGTGGTAVRTPQDAWSDPVTSLYAALGRHRRLIGRVLAGEAQPAELLETAELRPARLAAAEPDLREVWAQIGDSVQRMSETAAAPLTLADIGGATEDNVLLREAIAPAGAQITVLPAGRRTTGRAFDVVLAVGALHRWPDARGAARDVAALLRADGSFIAVENTEMSPLGMLLAGLLETGFTDSGGNPITSPISDGDTWVRLLNRSGVDVTGMSAGPTPAVLLLGERRQEASEQSPTSYPAESQPVQTGPIRRGTESVIAALWSQLIPSAPQAREDSFFELGGDSLLATRFIAALQQRYGIVIPMRDLFADPRLAVVAVRVDAEISASTIQDTEEGVL